METILFPDRTDQSLIRDFYIKKYRDRRPDVIITVGPSPLRFMTDLHTKFFAGIPVVFCLSNGGVPGPHTLDSDFTGVEDDLSADETLRVAQRLLPGTKHSFVVGGTSLPDMQQEAVVRE